MQSRCTCTERVVKNKPNILSLICTIYIYLNCTPWCWLIDNRDFSLPSLIHIRDFFYLSCFQTWRCSAAVAVTATLGCVTLQMKVRGLFPPNNSKRRPQPLALASTFPWGRPRKPAGRQAAAGLTRRFWRREDLFYDLGGGSSSSQNLFRPTTRTTTTSCHGGFNRGAELSSAARAFLLLLVVELVLHIYVCMYEPTMRLL